MLHVLNNLFAEKHLKYPSGFVHKEIAGVEKQRQIRKSDNLQKK
jgi:hypothetical protein